MRKIWKYTLAVKPLQNISMPGGARILSVQTQGEQPQVWALCDPAAEAEMRHFQIFGTGHDIEGVVGMYLGSFQLQEGNFVGHVFEMPKPSP